MVAGVDLYEPQFLALFVFGGFVILSSIVYLVSAFSMQEKSYEDAIAEQRARLEKENHHVKEPKPKKKYSRKKKERERSENSIGHQDQIQEEILPAKVEEVVDETPPARQPTPKAKSPKAKKESKKAAVAAAVVTKETAAPKQQSPKAAPVEEIIVSKVQQVSKTAPPTKVHKEKPQKMVEEPVMIQKQETTLHAAPPPSIDEIHQDKQQAAPTSPNKPKKNKVAPSGDTDGTSARSLINTLKSVKLSESDVQKIVEVLQKQHGSALPAQDWIKANQRSDPVAGLKKQLQEKEQALHNEILLAQSSAQKVKEVRAELVQEKSRGNQIEGRYKEKADVQAREVEALHIRMRQTHESHAHETQAFQNRIKQMQEMMDETNMDVVKQLREENARLKTEVNHAAQQKEQIMGAELGRLNNELQKMQAQMAAKDAHIRQSDEMRRNLENKTAQYEQQIKQYDAGSQENVNALSKRLGEVSEELRKSESRSHTAVHDLEKSKEALRLVTSERDEVTQQTQVLQRQGSENKNTVTTLESKLKDTTNQAQNLQSQIRSVESQKEEEKKLRIQKEEDIKSLKNDKIKLETQIQDLKKIAEEVQKSSAPNGDLTDQSSKTILITEHERTLDDKVKTIEALQQQLASSKTEMETVRKDVEKQTKKNNDLREKNWKAMEALAAAEKSNVRLNQDVKSAKDDSQSHVIEEQQLAKKALLKIFPSIKVDNNLNHKDWLAQFEMSATKLLGDQSTFSETKVKEVSSKLSTVEEENRKLSTQCQHYQSVLAETEGILNQLQTSVESEAKKWQEKLKVSESSLVQAKRENATLKQDMEKKIEATADTQRLTKELAAAKASVAELERANQAAAKEYDTSCNELAVVKQQLTQLQKELVAATQRAEKGSAGNAELSQYKSQLLKQQEQVETLSADLSTANSKIQELTKAYAASSQQLDATKTKDEAMQKELKTNRETMCETQQKLSDTEQQLKDVEAQLNKANAEKAETGKSSEQLKEQLEAAQKLSNKSEEQLKELETLEAAFTKEKGLNRELALAAGKLQMALKKMQSALHEEKKITAALKAQLEAKVEPAAEKTSSLTDSQVELQLADAAEEAPKADAKAEAKPTESPSGGSAV